MVKTIQCESQVSFSSFKPFPNDSTHSCCFLFTVILTKADLSDDSFSVIISSQSSKNVAELRFSNNVLLSEEQRIESFGVIHESDTIDVMFKSIATVAGEENTVLEKLDIPVACLDKLQPSELKILGDTVELVIIFALTPCATLVPIETDVEFDLNGTAVGADDVERLLITLPKLSDTYSILKSTSFTIYAQQRLFMIHMYYNLTSVFSTLYVYGKMCLNVASTVSAQAAELLDHRIMRFASSFDVAVDRRQKQLNKALKPAYKLILGTDGISKTVKPNAARIDPDTEHHTANASEEPKITSKGLISSLTDSLLITAQPTVRSIVATSKPSITKVLTVFRPVATPIESTVVPIVGYLQSKSPFINSWVQFGHKKVEWALKYCDVNESECEHSEDETLNGEFEEEEEM